MKKLLLKSESAKEFLPAVLCCVVIMGIWVWGCRGEMSERRWTPPYRKAVEAYRSGEYAKAVSLFKKALVFERSNAEIFLDIGAIYDDFLDDPSKAVSYYERYLELVGEDEKSAWVRELMEEARGRLTAPETEEVPGEGGSERPR